MNWFNVFHTFCCRRSTSTVLHLHFVKALRFCEYCGNPITDVFPKGKQSTSWSSVICVMVFCACKIHGRFFERENSLTPSFYLIVDHEPFEWYQSRPKKTVVYKANIMLLFGYQTFCLHVTLTMLMCLMSKASTLIQSTPLKAIVTTFELVRIYGVW